VLTSPRPSRPLTDDREEQRLALLGVAPTGSADLPDGQIKELHYLTIITTKDCQSIADQLMSVVGQSRHSDLWLATSDLPLSTDIDAPTPLVRFGPKAAVAYRLLNWKERPPCKRHLLGEERR
jgi:hypothetical protein